MQSGQVVGWVGRLDVVGFVVGARAAGHIPSVCTVDVAEEPAASRFVGGSRLICFSGDVF